MVLFTFLFVSCIDYAQSISYKDGNYYVYYKITLSKLLLAFADEDPEDLLAIFDEEMLSNIPKNAQFKRINTDSEAGVEFSFIMPPDTTSKDVPELLPRKKGNEYYIPFLLGNNNGGWDDILYSEDKEEEELIHAMLSSAKCRIMISKKVIPHVKTAYFAGLDAENYSVSVSDYGEIFCLEFPFTIFLEMDKYKLDNLIVVKKL